MAPTFADDVLYALFPPIHERLVPNFGAMTLDPLGYEYDGIEWAQPRLPFPVSIVGIKVGSLVDPVAGRQLCDGYTTFWMTQDGCASSIVALDSPATELDLVDLQHRHDVSTVQRTGDGKVKLFLPESLAVHDKNAWSLRPYSKQMAAPIRSARNLGSDIGERLLDLAVHVLSPANVGATLVWLLDDTASASTCFGTDHRKDVSPFGIGTSSSFLAVRSLCSQNDRSHRQHRRRSDCLQRRTRCPGSHRRTGSRRDPSQQCC